MRSIILLLVLLPILDLMLLGSAIGFWGAVIYVLVTGAVGVMLMRSVGREGLMHAQANNPGQLAASAIGAVATALAGVLLIHPGVVTDVLALVCVVPFFRALLVAKFGAQLLQGVAARGGFSTARPANDEIIEGEFEPVAERDDSVVSLHDTPDDTQR